MAKLSLSVTAELVNLLYRYVPAVLAANLINGMLVVAALWRHADHGVLVAWFAVLMAMSLGRVALWVSRRHRPPPQAQAARWARRYTIGATLSGMLWGSTAFLFMDTGNPVSLILVSFVIGGMGAGAVTGLSAHLPAFYLYLLASMVPLEARLLSLGDRASLAMAGMAIVYAAGLVIIARSFNAALIRALVLNEENGLLLATREQEVLARTADLQAANAELEREIAERKEAEIRLEEARAVAEQANQAKSRFLAAASHDLRQPLQSMFLFAAALHPLLRGNKGLDALRRLERSLEVLRDLLNSLLDLSQLDVNVIKPNLAVFPLRPMIEEIATAYGRVAALKGLELHCGILDDVLVRSDQMLLGRMIRNLVENALRYTEHGGILLSCSAEGDVVRIEVTDSGIGISVDQLERIFEEFHQVGNPERDKSRGLGLGLAIVQRLSRALNHPVAVRSEPGIGSTFSIALPNVRDWAMEPAADEEEIIAESGGGRRAILIDDDPMVLQALGLVLEQWGFGVISGESEEGVVDGLRPELPPHLIIADYRLRSGRVGTHAIQNVRSLCGTEIPSILLTGETGNEWQAEAQSLGATVLRKPVNSRDLARALKTLMDGGGD